KGRACHDVEGAAPASRSRSRSSRTQDSAGNVIARPAVEWRARPHPERPERGEAPVAVSVSAVRFAQLSQGWSLACGVDRTGEALCWGDNGTSRLGAATPLRRAAAADADGRG